MKRLFFAALSALLLLAPNAYAQKIKLNSGTAVSVRIVDDLSSKQKHNQAARAIVDRDVTDITGEKVIIRRGTPVQVGTAVRRAKGVGKPGSIKIDCISTLTVDGQTVPLMGGLSVQGDDRMGVALGCGLGLGLTILCPVGLFLLCIKGENVEIPANTVIYNVVVNNNCMVAAE